MQSFEPLSRTASPLFAVDATYELSRRPRRATKLEAQSRALALDGKSAEVDRGAKQPIATAANKDRFMAILAHELRSRLQPTKNAVEVLKRETLDAPTRHSLAAIIDRQIGGMTRLIDDLLDITSVRAGILRLRRTRANVSEIVEQAVEAVRPLLTARRHTVVISLPPEPPYVVADVTWLAQALQNLLSNAAKYTNPGGTIGISAEHGENEISITVSDNGIGIASADLETIFDLYAQAGQAGTERSAGGVGLGLYLSRLLVEGHGGVIRACSAGPGRGSQFIVRLPCEPPSVIPQGRDQGWSGGPGANGPFPS